jgi:hypothetical protein
LLHFTDNYFLKAMSVAQVEAANNLANEPTARPKNALNDGSHDTVPSANNSNGATIAADNGRSHHDPKPPTDDEDQVPRDGFPYQLRAYIVFSVLDFWVLFRDFCMMRPTGKYCLTGARERMNPIAPGRQPR